MLLQCKTAINTTILFYQFYCFAIDLILRHRISLNILLLQCKCTRYLIIVNTTSILMICCWLSHDVIVHNPRGLGWSSYVMTYASGSPRAARSCCININSITMSLHYFYPLVLSHDLMPCVVDHRAPLQPVGDGVILSRQAW